MKCYLASQFGWKDKLKKYAEELMAAGIECTSSWLNESYPTNATLQTIPTDAERVKLATADLIDINASDVVVLFTVDPTTPTVRGGRHFEAGYAFGIAMSGVLGGAPKLVICGPRENIFHYLPQITVIPTWEETKRYLVGGAVDAPQEVQ